MDSLHKGLALACAVLLLALISSYAQFAQHGLKELGEVGRRGAEQLKTMEALQAEADALGQNPAADAGRLDDVRTRLASELRVRERHLARTVLTMEWVEFIADMKWFVAAPAVASIALIWIGWARWMRKRRYSSA